MKNNEYRKPTPVSKDRYKDPNPYRMWDVCKITLNGHKYQVVTFEPHPHSPWGFSEDAQSATFRKKGSRLPALGYANNLPPAIQQQTFLHECIHGWFGTKLTEKQVDRLTNDLWRAMMTADIARRKPRSTSKKPAKKKGARR